MPKKARAKPPANESGPTQAQINAWEKDFMAGSKVVHKQICHGEIPGRLGSAALIIFESYDKVKRIVLTTCLRNELIRLAGQ